MQSRIKINDGRITTNKSVICEKFNNFLLASNHFRNKKPKQSQTPEFHLGNSLINSIFLAQVSTEEIINIIYELKYSTPGPDDRTAEALRLSSSSITFPLVHILNLSSSEGVFPGN